VCRGQATRSSERPLESSPMCFGVLERAIRHESLEGQVTRGCAVVGCGKDRADGCPGVTGRRSRVSRADRWLAVAWLAPFAIQVTFRQGCVVVRDRPGNRLQAASRRPVCALAVRKSGNNRDLRKPDGMRPRDSRFSQREGLRWAAGPLAASPLPGVPVTAPSAGYSGYGRPHSAAPSNRSCADWPRPNRTAF
jgi:hypothetical protein